VNDLIAEAHGPAWSEAHQSLRIIGPASGFVSALSGGEWALAEGIAGGVGMVADTAEFIVDPIASMAGSAAGFLLDYMPPLPQMLDALAGSPSAVAAQAQTWTNVSTRVASCAEEYSTNVARSLDGWQGPAATGYQAYADLYRQGLDVVASVTGGLGDAMQVASAVVGFVRSIVRDIIADLVGKLISWATQVITSVGIGTAWVVPQAVTAIALRVRRVQDWLERLTRGIRSACKLLDDLNARLMEVIPGLRRIADLLEKAAFASPFPGNPDNLRLSEIVRSANSISNTLGRTYQAAVTASGSGHR